MRLRVSRLAGTTGKTAFDCRLDRKTETTCVCLDPGLLRVDGTVRTCRSGAELTASLSPVQRLRFT